MSVPLIETPAELAEFRAALPGRLRGRWRRVSDEEAQYRIEVALSNGWSVEQLARACSAGALRLVNASDVITSRLRALSAQRPPETHVRRFVQPKPPCGMPGCDPETRWFTDLETGRLVGRCPECWTEPS